MTIHIHHTAEDMGRAAAEEIARRLDAAIRQRGEARLLLSTGASQFEMMRELVRQPVDFSRVTMFHLDEYVGLPESHKASFRRYLKERFALKVPLKEAVYVSNEGDVEENLRMLERRIREKPVDVGVIGIGENAHIAFNDPPADFDTEKAYHVVTLDERCRRQQVGEGWFDTVDDVPTRAISMTVKQILSCRCIVSVVPHGVKREAVQKTLSEPVCGMVPATALKTHPDWTLYLDSASAAGFIRC